MADTGLPVEAVVDEVRAALEVDGPRHAVVVAPPGAGKTTVLPLRLLDEPWLAGRRIVVLEPRRLAARAAARRMADLVGEQPGATVGYRTRDERVVGSDTRIEVVTEGILVRRLQADPTLDGTGLVILDEVHERNLVTDLSLALLLDARSAFRPGLRVLAMSATVAAERLAAVIGGDGPGAPVIRSLGRAHHVTLRHAAPGPRERIDAHAARTIARALQEEAEGDLLAFLPGAAEIRRVSDRLTAPGALSDSVDVRPLFGALGPAEQDAALAPSPAGRRRVVLATDIAESSLTVAGVRIVVDAGLVRVPRYDPGSGLTRLHTEPASRASADQRSGRAGRLGPGIAHRLWAAADEQRRPAFPVAEIAVVDLAGFALELAAWGATPDALALVDQPPPGAYAEATSLLRRLGALDGDGRPTATGRAMADLPLHPRLARLVVDGGRRSAWTAVVVAALLEERDVLRGRPGEVPADLGLRARLVADDGSDHPDTDRHALRTVRRRARELGRRQRTRPGRLDPDAVGALVALAYPDRLAQARRPGAFRLRGGGGGHLPTSDPLAGSAWLAVAGLQADGADARITTAAPVDAKDVRAAVGDDVESVTTVAWDATRDDLRSRTEERSGALVLSSSDGPAPAGEATVDALVERVAETGGGALRWTPAARALQGRLAFLHGVDPGRWPDTTDAALLAGLDDWLRPLLPGATGRRDLERVDVAAALRSRLDHRSAREVDRLAPTSFVAASGREVPITYADGRPVASARVQDLYGTVVHPTVADGQVAVVLHLLSPAARPVQITADLPGFWSGSWSAVRKDLAGRYPKHTWPTQPTVADAVASRRRRGSR
ncbi:MAG: putative ATP-dependent helicase [Acidimicrobiales bacterium]|nr:putative ATP-dependent helicase [Acidimicrobiales bacterium]